jgi:hypothetical protein
MNIEFHYYITYIIAIKAGFNNEQAYKIAYSSQYTDDNVVSYTVHSNGGTYKNYITQTENILKPKQKLQRIYLYFHYFPGSFREITTNALPRRDGKLHLLNTISNNRNARKLINSALESENLYRIGISTHTFTDTFTHQNFVGLKDSFNDIDGFVEKIIPSIGHEDAKYSPDIPSLVWYDRRLSGECQERHNKEYILMAASELFNLYSSALGKTKGLKRREKMLLNTLSEAIGDESEEASRQDKKRIDNYRNILTSITRNRFKEYGKSEWIKEATYIRTELAISKTPGFAKTIYFWRKNYEETDWFKFQEAVKKNQIAAERILRPVLGKIGYDYSHPYF